MFKEIIISAIVIVLIIGLNWYIQGYTKTTVTNISDRLTALREQLKNNNENQVNEDVKKMHDKWDENYKILAIFIEHDELEKVETNIVSLEGYIEVNDYNMAINELNKGIFVLKHIAEKYDFSLENVF